MKTPYIAWHALAPELILLGGAGVLLLAAVFLRGRAARDVSLLIGLGCFAAAAIVTITLWDDHGGSWPVIANQFVFDRYANMIRLVVAASGACALAAAYGWPRMRERGAEFACFLLVAAAGMDLLVASQSFVSLFVSLELFSISLYALCAFEVRNEASLEAALKYLVLGSIGSAVLLYGASFLYGVTGSFQFQQIAKGLHGQTTDALVLAGTALVLTGLAFKIAVVPFHMWTPDVYEGAPTPVTAFMSAATKAAAFAILLRVLVGPLAPEADEWRPAVIAISIATMLFANVVALRQRNIKRILAYSSVGHAGYLLMAVVPGTAQGAKALVFYLVVYAATTLGSLVVVTIHEREIGAPATIDSMRAWGFAHPILGVVLSVCLLSLAGFPPTAGFVAKVYIFAAAINGGYTYLAIIGAIGTMISLGYYLRIGISLYDRGAADHAMRPPVPGVALATIAAAAAAVVVIWLGVYPPNMLDWAGQAAHSLLAAP
jgi:NADH-quinone oxidoreductase subunit N